MGIAGGGPGSCADVDAAADVCCGGGDGENSREQMGMAGGTGGKFGSSAMIDSSAAATSSSIDDSSTTSCLGCTITTTLAGPVPTAMVDFFLMTARSVTRYAAAVPACVLGPSYDFMTCSEPLLTASRVSMYSVRRIRPNTVRDDFKRRGVTAKI